MRQIVAHIVAEPHFRRAGRASTAESDGVGRRVVALEWGTGWLLGGWFHARMLLGGRGMRCQVFAPVAFRRFFVGCEYRWYNKRRHWDFSTPKLAADQAHFHNQDTYALGEYTDIPIT